MARKPKNVGMWVIISTFRRYYNISRLLRKCTNLYFYTKYVAVQPAPGKSSHLGQFSPRLANPAIPGSSARAIHKSVCFASGAAYAAHLLFIEWRSAHKMPRRMCFVCKHPRTTGVILWLNCYAISSIWAVYR